MTPEEERLHEAQQFFEDNTDPQQQWENMPPLLKELIAEIDDIGSGNSDSNETNAGCGLVIAASIPTISTLIWSTYQHFQHIQNG